jgi:hypothetical protein
MKQNRLAIFFSISLLLIAGVLIGASNTLQNNTETLSRSVPIEVTYKAQSPVGALGGSILPASCESNAWNANGGYHLDGVTADPGNCAVTPTQTARCGAAATVRTTVAPSSALCSNGTASSVSGASSDSWSWSCTVSASDTATCSAPKSNVVVVDPPQPPATGLCHPATNGRELSTRPTENLCVGAVASIVTGTGTAADAWRWTCTESVVASETTNIRQAQSLQSMQLAQVSGGAGSGCGFEWCATDAALDPNQDGGLWQTIVDTVITPIIETVITPIIEVITPTQEQPITPVVVTPEPPITPSAVVTPRVEQCSATLTDAVNEAPSTPVIGGTVEIGVNISTANTIVATDPEGDKLFYEIDWNGDGSVDGTTGNFESGVVTQIGHQYTSIGTYTVRGRAVEVDGGNKRSGWATHTIRVVNSDCIQTNACGVVHVRDASGSCVAQPLPVGYGNTCTSAANNCGSTNSGTINCAGTCSATRPADTSCTCQSLPNNCGNTNTGTLVGGVCNATRPADEICPTPTPTTINSFRASPKFVATGKSARLFWEVTGNFSSCSISYTTNTNPSAVSVVGSLTSRQASIDTGPITEKRFYLLTCGANEAIADVSVFSLTEI